MKNLTINRKKLNKTSIMNYRILFVSVRVGFLEIILKLFNTKIKRNSVYHRILRPGIIKKILPRLIKICKLLISKNYNLNRLIAHLEHHFILIQLVQFKMNYELEVPRRMQISKIRMKNLYNYYKITRQLVNIPSAPNLNKLF
jgi:hypothetical protein